MKTEVFIQTDENGKVIAGRTTLAKALKQLSGLHLTVTIEKRIRKRSNEQNAYFHGVVVPMVSEAMTEAGWREAVDLGWVKAFIKKQFLTRTAFNEKTGEGVEFIQDTSALTTSEFMDLIADVQKWGSEYLNIYIPDPNEQTSLNYEQNTEGTSSY